MTLRLACPCQVAPYGSNPPATPLPSSGLLRKPGDGLWFSPRWGVFPASSTSLPIRRATWHLRFGKAPPSSGRHADPTTLGGCRGRLHQLPHSPRLARQLGVHGGGHLQAPVHPAAVAPIAYGRGSWPRPGGQAQGSGTRWRSRGTRRLGWQWDTIRLARLPTSLVQRFSGKGVAGGRLASPCPKREDESSPTVQAFARFRLA